MTSKPYTEKQAVAALQRVAKRWPDSLWLFSASGRLCVMRKTEDGTKAETPLWGIDPDYELAVIDIENDGGDW